MKRFVVVLLFVVAAFPHAVAAAPKALAPYAGQCGIPATQPVWADFGWPSDQFDPILGKPGIVLGASSGAYPARMRATGAATVYFDLNFNKRIGTTTKPADPATMQTKAQSLFTFAVQQTGCATPVIVLNELSGASLVTPWSDNNAQYRQNALAFVQNLAALGAHPVLLVAAHPYTGGDAAVWWQQAAAAAELVREDYVPATATWKQGSVLGNRTLRDSYRTAVADFTAIGIAPSRLGLMLSFTTTHGFGGRNGLEPAEAWYEVAKWQALAVGQVAAETGIASVWSWGWGEWTAAEQDPDKPYALCAWLWVRSPTFCNAPKAIGTAFDTSLTEGQLSVLAPGVQCLVGKQALTDAAIRQLQQVTGDPDTATSALFERLVESAAVPVPQSEVLAAERGVILQEFRGSRAIYNAALAKAHASVDVARGILADELRRAKVQASLPAVAPSDADVQTFYTSYPDLPVRLVSAAPSPSWLGKQKQGLALSQVAPGRLFSLATGKKTVLLTSQGSFTVKPLQDALPLGAVPLGRARPAIVAALQAFERGQQFEQWTVSKQRAAQNTAVCAKDDFPQPAAIDLTSYLPFLRLG
ncbi:MAG TPA: hypothetical protein VMS63_03795 [Gaiellaceae bacterium]|nr:hypothetical protein [Gaiellaceae bacterium]